MKIKRKMVEELLERPPALAVKKVEIDLRAVR